MVRKGVSPRKLVFVKEFSPEFGIIIAVRPQRFDQFRPAFPLSLRELPPSFSLPPSMNLRRTRRRAGNPKLDVAKQLGRENFQPQLASHGKS
jgi:hypothetical protein